jgi:hypothetical protein
MKQLRSISMKDGVFRLGGDPGNRRWLFWLNIVAQRSAIDLVTFFRIITARRLPTEAQALRIAAALKGAKERQVASRVLEMAGFDPPGIVDGTGQKDGDGKRPVLPGH